MMIRRRLFKPRSRLWRKQKKTWSNAHSWSKASKFKQNRFFKKNAAYLALKKNKKFLRNLRKKQRRPLFRLFYRKLLRPSLSRRKRYNSYGVIKHLAKNYQLKRAVNSNLLADALGPMKSGVPSTHVARFGILKKTSLAYGRLQKLSTKLAHKLWFGQRTLWYWKHLYRIKFSKKIIRAYNRSLRLPALRFRFLYIYELFIFWFYFFFKKIERFLFYFFYELWCNVFFSLKNYKAISSIDDVSFSQLFCKSFVYCLSRPGNMALAFTTQHRKIYLKARLSLFARFAFSGLFKLYCLFWTRRKEKHNVLEVSSWRWRKKFRGYKPRRKKRIPWWKKNKKTKFFSTKKSLRWRFRRQHGPRWIRSYNLRASLRQLKPRSVKKLGKRFKAKPKRINRRSKQKITRGWFKVPGNLSLIKGFSRLSSLRPIRSRFLSRRRRNIINRYINRKRSALQKATGARLKAKLVRHLLLFKAARRNISRFKPFAFFRFLSYCLSNRRILKKFLRQKISPVKAKAKSSPFPYRRASRRARRLYRLFKNRFISRLHWFARKMKSRKKRQGRSFLNRHRRIKRAVTIIRRKKQLKILTSVPMPVLYAKLLCKKLRIRRLQRIRHRAKVRRLTSKINRRKLLLAGAAKGIFQKKSKNITFFFKMLNV